MATCPAGHVSSTADYCDTCGAPIASGDAGGPSETVGGDGAAADPSAAVPAAQPDPAAGPTPGPQPEAAAPAETAPDPGAALASTPATGGGEEPEPPAAAAPDACPSCGAPLTGRFCESCGYDVETGAPAAPRPVTLLLGADRGHWERMVGEGEPPFPVAVPALTLELTGDRLVLGRVRSGAVVDVDLALTGAAADPAVSHRQCVFVREGETWIVSDMDSANGTWVNDADSPLAAGERHELADGDRLLMGAWTCLTVQATPRPPTGETD